MTLRISGLLLVLASTCIGQDTGAVQQSIAGLRASLAKSREALTHYTWVENTDLFVNGEIRKHDQAQCTYGADGELQKTPISAPHQPANKKQGKKAQKKLAALQQYADRFHSLVDRYAPPDPEKISQAEQKGNVSLQQLPDGKLAFVVKQYLKEGDEMAVTFDPGGSNIVRFNVFTYLDGVQDQIGLQAKFDQLHDGTHYVSEIEMSSASQKMLVKTSNYGHKKLQ